MTRQGIEGVRAGGPGDAVCGVVPAHTARPRNVEELAGLLAEAARHNRSVAARGGGTALDWGGRPTSVDLLVDTGALSRIDHDAGDLVVEVGAGAPVADLAGVLAAAGQRLSVDPVRAGGTVGGLLATGLSGPRRLLTGALRDLVIGMTVVRPDGVVARSGGRVVKNVAGYDLAKLHVGGHGTLGVIASAAFRLHPLPPALRTLGVSPPTAAAAEQALDALRRSTVVPAAVELDRLPGGELRLTVVLEGTPAGVEARAAQTARLLAAALPAGTRVTPETTGASRTSAPTDGREAPQAPGNGGTPATTDGHGTPGGDESPGNHRTPAAIGGDGAPGAEGAPGVRVSEGLPPGWGLLPTAGTLVRLSVPPAESVPAAVGLGSLAEDVHGTAVRITGSAPRGALVLAFAPGASAAAVGDVLAQARSHTGWTATVVRAEAHLHEAGVDLWGEVPGLAVMRVIRDAMDPGHRMAPGRFVTDAPPTPREERP
ncbi:MULTISPECIES: FAD-binding oxidoreductase [unclassified Nocardiopsis]|uniref:FAD-binding oxidoreductase n=1 Tax=Nocardiopsis TaxID=2013 RepID=UPI00387AAEA5